LLSCESFSFSSELFDSLDSIGCERGEERENRREEEIEERREVRVKEGD
jgi:hypothetical protein